METTNLKDKCERQDSRFQQKYNTVLKYGLNLATFFGTNSSNTSNKQMLAANISESGFYLEICPCGVFKVKLALWDGFFHMAIW